MKAERVRARPLPYERLETLWGSATYCQPGRVGENHGRPLRWNQPEQKASGAVELGKLNAPLWASLRPFDGSIPGKLRPRRACVRFLPLGKPATELGSMSRGSWPTLRSMAQLPFGVDCAICWLKFFLLQRFAARLTGKSRNVNSRPTLSGGPRRQVT